MTRAPILHGLRRQVHFVGVGGIGMSGLAEILLNLGYDVSGSDLRPTEITARLQQFGMRFCRGHDAGNVADAAIVVQSSAVSEDNPEIAAARAARIPVIHRSDLLADLLRLKPNAVVVGGTHGKTTTTSMVSSILDRANIGATSIIGGILHRSGTNAQWGTGDYIVAEADEHDGSFLRLHPTIGVVTNIDAEHLEHYGSLDNIKRAFTDFCNGIPFYGQAIVCWDDANTRSIIPDLDTVCVTYGLSEGATIRGTTIELLGDGDHGATIADLPKLRTRFQVECADEHLSSTGTLGTICLHSLGEDNVRNALAAVAVGLCLGMPFELIAEGLGDFSGVRRRLQLRGMCKGIAVVEDYAHHPTEIASTLAAVRWVKPGRIVCVFQPHLYSRTKYLYREFASSLCQADRTIVTDIYGSREAPMQGVDAGIIVDAAQNGAVGTLELVRDLDAVPDALMDDLGEGDVVLLLGAGDVNRVAEPLLRRIEAG